MRMRRYACAATSAPAEWSAMRNDRQVPWML